MFVKVALFQMMHAGADQPANLLKGEAYCRQAQAMGADIALFPEMWNIGYALPDLSQTDAIEGWKAHAISSDDRFVTHFQSLARELDMAIALTYLQKWPGKPRNVVSLFNRHGRLCLTYAKVHTCDFDKEAALTPGDEFFVCDLDTAQGEVKVGAMICYDREFPEPARILMLQGAELILTPNACELEVNRLGQFRARAYENMLGVATTNYPEPEDNGHSAAYSPVVFSEQGVVDPVLVEAGAAEGIFLAEFDMDQIRLWRQREAWGNAYRKPRLYQALFSLEVKPPFVRADARR